MDIPALYNFKSNAESFREYKVPKAYQNTRKDILKKPHSFKSRQTFVSDLQALAKKSPGVGKYVVNPEKEKPKKNHKKIDFKKLQKEGTHTYLDDEIKKKNKVPPVGKYDPERDKTDEIRSKYKTKNDKDRKKAPLFRPTILDEFNTDTANVAPGHYENGELFGSKSILGSISPKHKRSLSLPKIPSAFDYSPIPASYDTFSRKMSVGSIKPIKETGFGEKPVKKFETLGPGPKYSLISDWVVKKDKNGHKHGQNYIKSTSNLKSPSIYH